jgi:hypothetical protein
VFQDIARDRVFLAEETCETSRGSLIYLFNGHCSIAWAAFITRNGRANCMQ